MLKDGAALERLAEADRCVFDKTGTLTEGEPRLVDAPLADVAAWRVAVALGAREPPSAGAGAARRSRGRAAFSRRAVDDIAERAGLRHGAASSTASCAARPARLGRRRRRRRRLGPLGDLAPHRQRGARCRFRFEDALRADAAATVAGLKRARARTSMLLSGDRAEAVAAVAAALGIDAWRARMLPDRQGRVRSPRSRRPASAC